MGLRVNSHFDNIVSEIGGLKVICAIRLLRGASELAFLPKCPAQILLEELADFFPRQIFALGMENAHIPEPFHSNSSLPARPLKLTHGPSGIKVSWRSRIQSSPILLSLRQNTDSK